MTDEPIFVGVDLAAAQSDLTRVVVLDNHDHTRAIGTIRIRDGALVVRFDRHAAMTRSQFFEVFGNCGIQVLEFLSSKSALVVPDPDRDLIVEAEILEWSRPAVPSQPG